MKGIVAWLVPLASVTEVPIAYLTPRRSRSGRGRMKYGLTFRHAEAEDFAAVLELASQLARHIEAPVPHLTFEQFETYYLCSHAPMRLLLAVRDSRIVGLISWTLTHELYSADARVYISDVSVDHAARGQS